jgi:hypothetical protein
VGEQGRGRAASVRIRSVCVFCGSARGFDPRFVDTGVIPRYLMRPEALALLESDIESVARKAQTTACCVRTSQPAEDGFFTKEGRNAHDSGG